MGKSFDFIVVGAGSAGCALANRLSSDPTHNVLLLEAGPTDWNPLIRLPVGEALTVGSAIDWQNRTEPEPGLDGRRLDVPRGKVLGGSSAINGQLYVRGHAQDYDDWAAAGCTGWSYTDVERSFNQSEKWAGAPSPHRGSSGPVETIHGRYRTPLFEAFLQAGRQLGHAVRDDYNQGDHEGFSWSQFTQEHKRARRCSSAHAYLNPARSRPNLSIVTGARVTNLNFDGNRCVGLQYVKGGNLNAVSAGEIILSAGAYVSPQLLMLSGIGPAQHLTEMGIPVRHDLSGVGQNLQDHCGGLVQVRCTQPVTYHALRNPIRLAAAVAEMVFSASGPLTVFPMNTIAFLRSSPEQTRPDLQFLFFPVATDLRGGKTKYAAFSGYAVTWGIMRPKSVGSITLHSTDPLAAPRILHNYLTHPDDIATTNNGLKIARQLHAQSAFDRFRGAETDPGLDAQDEAALTAYNRRTTHSHYHPVGSCRMGVGADAVVDPRLRVHGIEGLRVADASIMPSITSGNTNAPSIMIGEKAAEMILRC